MSLPTNRKSNKQKTGITSWWKIMLFSFLFKVDFVFSIRPRNNDIEVSRCVPQPGGVRRAEKERTLECGQQQYADQNLWVFYRCPDTPIDSYFKNRAEWIPWKNHFIYDTTVQFVADTVLERFVLAPSPDGTTGVGGRLGVGTRCLSTKIRVCRALAEIT